MIMLGVVFIFIFYVSSYRMDGVMATVERARLECGRSWVPDSIGLWLQRSVLAPRVVDRGFQIRSGYGYSVACSSPRVW
jgi:hypothetical protein